MSENAPSVAVLIADDERLMRSGLRLMIDGAEGISVSGEATNGAEAIDQAQRLDPDVILMDLRMPIVDGIEATRRLTESGARAAVVVLTAFDTDTFLVEALRAGAVSFLLKDSPPKDVVRAVHDAAAGEPRFSSTVLQRLVRLTTQTTVLDGPPDSDEELKDSSPIPTVPEILTVREWEVAGLVAQGLTNSEIADALFLSVPTVKTHVTHLFEKLLVTNRVQLALKVLELQKGRSDPRDRSRTN